MNYLLIWDIDGTLIQGRGIGRRAMDSAFFELHGIKEGFKDIDMAGRVDAVIVDDAYKLHNLKLKSTRLFFEKQCFYLQQEIDKLDSSIEAPGILTLLKELSSTSNFFNVLGTGNILDAARLKLDVHKMNNYFPTGGFGDEIMQRWQIIEKAAKRSRDHFKINFEKSNIFIIGDTPKDVECGKILDFKTVGVATGVHTFDELKSCGADFVFKSFEDTKAFFEIFK